MNYWKILSYILFIACAFVLIFNLYHQEISSDKFKESLFLGGLLMVLGFMSLYVSNEKKPTKPVKVIQKKWKLGNQEEAYELVETYVGWLPKGFTDWEKWVDDNYWEYAKPKDLTLENVNKTESVTFDLHVFISKEAFPLNFYGEEIAQRCHRFFIVSLSEKPSEKFIIPLL